MREHESQRGDGAPVQDEASEDRGAVVVALAAAAISGCFMGLLIQGQVAVAVMIAVLVPLMGFVGWWLRGATQVRDLQREP
jgi:hypothetical protein